MQPAAPALLGRRDAFDALEGAARAALAGRGGVVLVSGEAGIGKSALVEALLREAGALGFLASRGRAWEFADAPPMFPVRRCLQALGVAVDVGADAQGHGRFALWEEALEGLARASHAAAQLWVIEDVHAADLQTLDLLSFLTQPLRALRALVVVTARPQDPRLGEPMQQRLSRIARDGLELRLEPLAAAQAIELAERVLGRALEAPLCARLLELSAGNPLHVLEYARALKEAHGHPGALAAVPSSLRQAVLERARFLPDRTREVLDACAVLGREAPAVSVARMRAALPAQVIDWLVPALKAGLVQETEPGAFRFSHVLVRDALYEATEPAARAQLHAAAAQALSTDAAPHLDLVVARAHHALLALPGGAQPEAQAWLVQALSALRANQAFDRAFALYRRMHEARGAGLLEPADTAELFLGVELARLAGRYAEGRTLCEELLARARAQADGPSVARAALLLGATLQPGYVDRALVAVLHEASAMLDPSEVALRCRVQARLSGALQPAPDRQMPIGMARAALAEARAQPDPEVVRDVLLMGGSALVDYAPIAERIAWAEELFERSQSARDPEAALRACLRLAMDRVCLGDFVALALDVERMEELTEQLGRAPRHRWRPLLIASMQAALRGDFALSERCMVEVSQLQSHCDDPSLGATLFMHRTLVLRLRRRDDEACQHAADIDRHAGRTMHWPGIAAMIRALIYARVGDRTATEAQLVARRPHDALLLAEPEFAFIAAEATALSGTDAERRDMLARLGRIEGVEVSHGHVGYMGEGPATRLRGLLEASLGEHSLAATHLQDALARVRRNGHRPLVAQLQFELGHVWTALGDAAAARTSYDEAAALAEELGMDGLRKALGVQARTEPRGAVPRSEALPAPSERLSLAREGEGWRLQRGARTLLLRDGRGVRLLSCLIERPGEELHVLALAGDETASGTDSDAGELLDDKARAAYRGRLVELDQALAEAERDADLGRVRVLREERELLLQELSRAVGLGGRVRRAGSAAERARVRVQKRIKEALDRIEAQDPQLGRYLTGAVRTGTFCSFRP